MFGAVYRWVEISEWFNTSRSTSAIYNFSLQFPLETAWTSVFYLSFFSHVFHVDERILSLAKTGWNKAKKKGSGSSSSSINNEHEDRGEMSTSYFFIHHSVSTELAFYVNWKTSDQRKHKKIRTEIKPSEQKKGKRAKTTTTTRTKMNDEKKATQEFKMRALGVNNGYSGRESFFFVSHTSNYRHNGILSLIVRSLVPVHKNCINIELSVYNGLNESTEKVIMVQNAERNRMPRAHAHTSARRREGNLMNGMKKCSKFLQWIVSDTCV